MSLDGNEAPLDEAQCVVVGSGQGITHFNGGTPLDVLRQLPLPGIVIFVHGVNSNGEWYDAAERGLCEGLNARLRRRDEDLARPGPQAGQLHPAQYIEELDADGFVNPEMNGRNFIKSSDSFSPVIRFRWGYKASGEELQAYGDSIFLNEHNYWGGGPFANGCSSLAELWGAGLDDQLFLWLHAQHLNPTSDRQVYSCPSRAYMVLAAYRLARLVESIRRKQADAPITIVCHSQGNMVGLCAAFLGDTFEPAKDAAGRSGRCVADGYVLCNPPYSLLEHNGTEDWSQGRVADPLGRLGRQTWRARTQTLAAFFELLRERAAQRQDDERVDRRMGNPCKGFTAQRDRERHGLNGSTHGRVTLYCCPHDQVISASPVQGIGWRGMSAAEIEATRGAGVFTQRVFAQGFEVGRRFAPDKPAVYDFWRDQYNRPQPGSAAYWQPASPPARYSVRKGMAANSHPVGGILTFALAPLAGALVAVANVRINALPPRNWCIPLQAPPLDEPFVPEARRFGAEGPMDEGTDPPAASLDKARRHAADDPYAQAAPAAQGDRRSESELRYEHHAVLRMEARREGLYRNDEPVKAEDKPATASDQYKQWRAQKLTEMLSATMDVNATDHSTILTNEKHTRLALAYDVAIGVCDVSADDMLKFRAEADWRFFDAFEKSEIHRAFLEYFEIGKIRNKSAFEWANNESEAAMPEKIMNERTHAPMAKLPGDP